MRSSSHARALIFLGLRIIVAERLIASAITPLTSSRGVGTKAADDPIICRVSGDPIAIIHASKPPALAIVAPRLAKRLRAEKFHARRDRRFDECPLSGGGLVSSGGVGET